MLSELSAPRRSGIANSMTGPLPTAAGHSKLPDREHSSDVAISGDRGRGEKVGHSPTYVAVSVSKLTHKTEIKLRF